MVGAHQNLNGLREKSGPYAPGMVCHPRASTCYTINLSTKFEVSISTHTKGDTKYRKCGGLEYLANYPKPLWVT